MSEVAVLGCGPAGLLAAHAAEIMGHRVTVISSKQRSVIGGAQYLHRAIPQVITEEAGEDLTFVKWGEADVYAHKVYGDPEARTSWSEYPAGLTKVWPMDGAYEALWARYRDRIHDRVVTAETVEKIMESASFDLVISSIPAKAICYDPNHTFESAAVCIVEDVIDQVASEWVDGNYIVMSGRDQDLWYRASRVFGHYFVEYPEGVLVPNSGKVVTKPLSTDCDCWAEVMRVGRYGRWKKGVLAHEAFEDTIGAVCAL